MTALRRDDWLSDILERDAWQVPVDNSGLDDRTREAIIRTDAPSFLYARLPTTATTGVSALSALGFNIVDTSITLERPVSVNTAPAEDVKCRFADPTDRNAVACLAKDGFSYSRFHLDPDVPRAAADRSRAEWAVNFFAGSRGDHMVIAEIDGMCTGFTQLLGPADGTLVIDLICVAENARRRGIASAMIEFAARQISDMSRIRVGTQVANIPSLRLYESIGFRTVSSSYVLHCHKR